MSDSHIKSAEEKKRDESRRVEIAMLGLLMEKHPKEARRKARELPPEQPPRNTFLTNEKSL